MLYNNLQAQKQIAERGNRGPADKGQVIRAPDKPYVPYNDRFVDPELMAGYWIKVKATMGDLARKVRNHNASRGFTSVLVIGDSGSGKTTVVTDLTHSITDDHKIPFIIKNYKEQQILNIKQILHQLPKKQNYIMRFDDVSFLIKKGKMKESDLMDMFHELTKVRHTVEGNVIAIFMIHYPYAIEKFMRQAGYRILTSITDDEREIYIKLFGPQWRRMIENFIVDDRYQTEESRFNLPDMHGNWQTLVPKHPFKLGLASRMGDLTYLVYKRNDCKKCNSEEIERNDAALIDKMTAKGYSERDITRAIKWFAYVHYGVNMLTKKERACYNMVRDLAHSGTFDPKLLTQAFKDIRDYRKQEKPHADELKYFIDAKIKEIAAEVEKQKSAGEKISSETFEKDATQEPDITEETTGEDQDEENDEENDDQDIQTRIEQSVMQTPFSEDLEA
jgi:hypothetical protein